VGLFVCDVTLDCLTVKSVIFAGFFQQCLRMSKDSCPFLNCSQVLIKVFTSCESFGEFFKDLAKGVDGLDPFAALDVNKCRVSLLYKVLGAVVTCFDFFEVVSASHSVNEAGSVVWNCHNV
jgi:hypothetical protein